MPEAVETGPTFPGTAGVMPAFPYVGGFGSFNPHGVEAFM